MPTAQLSIRAAVRRLRHASWSDQVKQTYLIFIGGVILYLCLPSGLRAVVGRLVLAAPLLPIIAKDLAHFPVARARIREAVAARRRGALMPATLPPKLVGLVRMEAALRHGFMGWPLRRPRPQCPPGQALASLTYLERGSYGTEVAIVLMCCLVELPLDAAIMPLLVRDVAVARLIHVLMLVSVVSTLVWVLGDRWLVGAGRHVLTAEGLSLRIGARTEGLVPLAAIAGCERVREPVPAWCARHDIALHRIVRVKPSPSDQPNCVLVLRPDSGVRLVHMGVARDDLQCIFLYLDRPDDLTSILAGRSDRAKSDVQQP